MNSLYGGLGRLPDPVDDRDYKWRSYVPHAVAAELPLPDAYLRPDPAPVLSQGAKPQCVAYAGTSIKMEEEFRETGSLVTFDPEHLYARCKELDGIPNEEGTYPRTMLGVLKDEGMLSGDGTRYKIADFVRCESQREIKEAIFLDGPVALGMSIDTAWEKVSATGLIPMPTSEMLGGHETAIFGWNDHAIGRNVGGFYIKNSWDVVWGAGGYAVLPYQHFAAYADWDAWKVIDVENLAKIIAPTMVK